MSGDWIKMRGNLWDDPRVARIVDMTESSEAAVVGALYWLWATADQHTEDGIMPGLTCKAIDRKTGVKGFAEAMCSVGWLADHPDGVRIVNFEEHNGASAKKRCQTAKRVAIHSAANAKVTHINDKTNADSVSVALAREEKRREELIPVAKATLSSAPAGLPDCPHQKIISLFTKHLPHLSRPRSWTGDRQVNLRSRWRQCAAVSEYSDGYLDEDGGLKFWDSLFSYIATDTGLSKGFESQGRHWMPDLPWIVKASNFQKIMDGKYELQKNRA